MQAPSAGQYNPPGHSGPGRKLFGFPVGRMFAAETAILVELQTFRIVLFIFHVVIISLLAFCAGQSDLCAHRISLLKIGITTAESQCLPTASLVPLLCAAKIIRRNLKGCASRQPDSVYHKGLSLSTKGGILWGKLRDFFPALIAMQNLQTVHFPAPFIALTNALISSTITQTGISI